MTDYVIRIVLVVQGFFIIGVGIICVAMYWRNRLIGHISAIATSYCILIGVIIHSLYHDLYNLTSIKGLLVTLAFVLGDYALLRIVIRKRSVVSEIDPDIWKRIGQEVDDALERRFGRRDVL